MSGTERPQVVLVNRSLIQNENHELLIVQRASKDKLRPHLWEFPGGKLESGQTLKQALKREIFEETGLEIEPLSPLVYAQSYVIENGKYDGLPYVALFGVSRVVSGQVTLSEEHDNYAWEPYERVLEYDLTVECRKAAAALGEIILHGQL